MNKPITIAERVAVLENDVANIKTAQIDAITAHAALSLKIDKLANRLFGATCVISGLVVGSRVITVEQLHQLKEVLFP